MTCNRKVGKRRSLVDGSEVTGEIVKRLLRVMHHLHKCPFQPVYRLRSQPLLRLRVHHHQIGVVPLKLISFLAHFWVSEFVSIAESLGVNGENCAVGGGLPYRKVRVCVCVHVSKCGVYVMICPIQEALVLVWKERRLPCPISCCLMLHRWSAPIFFLSFNGFIFLVLHF